MRAKDDYLDLFRSCRFCHKHDKGLIKYDVRHYAHTRCLVSAKGEAFILRLPIGTLGRVVAAEVSDKTRDAILARML
jgi:hypothetical protein